jgi:hypothetical protein
MKHDMAMTKNVKRFLFAVQALQHRDAGIEGMGLLWGMPGEGKSTTVGYAVNMLDGVFVRANRAWTMTGMLSALSAELELPASRIRAPMFSNCVKKLMERPRPIFIDEADYMLKSFDMLDTLRDIYDLTGSPVILIGMEDLARRLQLADSGRFARRITQWVEFDGIDKSDARTLADTVCEIKLADDLLERLYDAAKANIGRMITGLARIETFGRTNKLDTVSAQDYGKREFFYDQPRFSRRAR